MLAPHQPTFLELAWGIPKSPWVSILSHGPMTGCFESTPIDLQLIYRLAI